MTMSITTDSTETRSEAARRLRNTMAACRVQFTWFGTSKSLTPEQRATAAEPFDAEGQFLSAGKKLLDTRHAAFRAVTAVRGKIESYWKGLTLAFPEPGVRLMKQEKVEEFAATMADYQAELEDAVRNLDEHYADLKRAGRRGSGPPRQRCAARARCPAAGPGADGPGRHAHRPAPPSDLAAASPGGRLMTLVVNTCGVVRAVYDELLDLAVLGPLVITRASHVEPTPEGRWQADLSPVGGPVLGPFQRRSAALEAEHVWLEEYWLSLRP